MVGLAGTFTRKDDAFVESVLIYPTIPPLASISKPLPRLVTVEPFLFNVISWSVISTFVVCILFKVPYILMVDDGEPIFMVVPLIFVVVPVKLIIVPFKSSPELSIRMRLDEVSDCKISSPPDMDEMMCAETSLTEIFCIFKVPVVIVCDEISFTYMLFAYMSFEHMSFVLTDVPFK